MTELMTSVFVRNSGDSVHKMHAVALLYAGLFISK